MKEIDNKNIKEKCFTEELENGMKVILIPKKEIKKKYVIWATKFGSIDNRFIDARTNTEIFIPDGVAHFLEHKMFEQENGVDSLYVLMALGIDANAYTTNDHTAYLFECTDHFYEGLDELMDYVQHPYFTDKNVEKEKGIIGQEIGMYDDDPEWQLFFGFVNCLYGSHAITKDIAGTVETIADITPEILYKCYNNFYKPSNMVICVVGDVDVNETLNIIKENVKEDKEKSKIERFYGEEKEEIYKKENIKKMDVNMPLFMFGFKDNFNKERLESGYEKDNREVVKYDVALQIALELIAGKSTKLFEDLYSEGLVTREFGLGFTYEEDYAYTSFDNESSNYNEVIKRVSERIKELKENGLDEEDFERAKKMLYGNFVKGFNDVSRIATMVISDYFKGINSFDYVESYKQIDKAYVEEVIRKHFDFDKMALSVIEPA